MLINRDFARAGLPQTIQGGGATDVSVDFPPVPEPGRYSIKFDLVSEGVDWFERCGSETTVKTFWVR